MLYYDRIDLTEGINVAKTNSSKKCMAFNQEFFNHGFKIPNFVCAGRHDLKMFCLIRGVYCYIIQDIIKYEADNFLEYSALEDRVYK